MAALQRALLPLHRRAQALQPPRAPRSPRPAGPAGAGMVPSHSAGTHALQLAERSGQAGGAGFERTDAEHSTEPEARDTRHETRDRRLKQSPGSPNWQHMAALFIDMAVVSGLC